MDGRPCRRHDNPRPVSFLPAEGLAMTAVDRPRIDLPAEDWFLASWRHSPPLPLPAVKAFDREAALKRLGDADSWRGAWAAFPPSFAIGEPEARFLFLARLQATTKNKPLAISKKLAKED